MALLGKHPLLALGLDGEVAWSTGAAGAMSAGGDVRAGAGTGQSVPGPPGAAGPP